MANFETEVYELFRNLFLKEINGFMLNVAD